jgi:hypothetical protein
VVTSQGPIGPKVSQPLPLSHWLERPLGHVVHHAITGDIVERLVLAYVLRLLADDHAQFALPVELGRVLGHDDFVVRTVDRSGGFHEHDGLGRDGHVRLARMVGEIQADGDEFGNPHVRHAQARLAFDQRQRFGLDFSQLRQPGRRNRPLVDLLHHGGQIADVALRVDHSRFLEAILTVTTKFHVFSVSRDAEISAGDSMGKYFT